MYIGPGDVIGKTRRALDSIVLDDAVATQDTVTQLIAAIRQVRRVVPDAATVVAQVATWVGQRVWVWEAAYQRPEGTAQEYALVPARRVVPLPDDASFDLGASLGVPFLSAHRYLTATEGGSHRLGPSTLDGRFALVPGGAGAVGNAAIQLAHWSDATVITAVSSPEKAQLAAAAGADHVIDYTRQDVESEIRKVAAGGLHTVVGWRPLRTVLSTPRSWHHLVRWRSRRTTGANEFTIPVRPLMMVNARWQFVLMYSSPAQAMAEAVEGVTDALLDRAIHVGRHAGPLLHHFPLEEGAAAHEAVEGVGRA